MTDSLHRTAETGSPAADERVLVRRSAGGDAAAFRVLVDLHHGRAYGLAFRLLRSEPDAEEVAQDAFVRAWRAIGEFRGDASFSTWLYRIVWRRALDRAAVLKTRREHEVALEPEGEGAGLAPAVEDRASADPERFERMIASLSMIQRAVLTLFYYEDRSVTEVARVLEIPEGTVKTHLSRARAALRRRFADDSEAGSIPRGALGGDDDLV
jgi:RNA polymerase sigma-70 factor (ECF subfamily)